MVVVSFSNADFADYEIGFPQPGVWYEILNSQADVYGGSGLGNGGSIETVPVANDGFADSASIVVPKMSVLVFRYNDPPHDFPDMDDDGDVDFQDFGYFQRCFADPDCGFDADFNNDGSVNLDDFSILTANLTGPCS